MTDIYNGFFLFLILFLVFLIASRVAKSRSPATILCLSSLGVYGLGLLFFIAFDISVKFFDFSSSYWFFSFSMMMVFFAVYKSISLRMMLDLENKPATLELILAEYIQQESYKERLNILIQNGFVDSTPQGYQLSLKGKKYATVILYIQKIFNINQSG
jgi:Na+-transporting NADH:ubiquinone oxidoreductase subunit NqrB